MGRPAKRATEKRHPFYQTLIKGGCELCSDCYAYMPPAHTVHARLTADTHASKLVVVGAYHGGREDLTVADLTADAPDAA